MAYTLLTEIVLGSSQTGLTLKAQLVDGAGVDVGGEVLTGFVELGMGNYSWLYAAYPDGFRGSVKFYTGTLPTGLRATAGIEPQDKTGIILAPTGLDAIATTAPTGPASTFREMLVQVWRRFFKRATKNATQIKTYADNNTTVITTQAYTSTGVDQDVGAAS